MPTAQDPSPHRRRLRKGAAAVEFAFVLPVLVTILIGATDFGRCYYSAIAVTNAARSGAAYASMNSSTASSQSALLAGVTSAVTDELSQSSAIDTSKVTVTISTTTEASGLTRTSVQVTYPFTTIVNWSYIPSSFNLTQAVVLRGIR